jgi:hypothetical protein
MTLSNLNSASLRSLIKLTERKEALVLEIKKIEAQLSSLILGKALPAGKRRGRPAKAAATVKSVKRAKRGTLKTKIYAALRAAGDEGLKVPALSKKIGVKSQNVHVWLSSTGKKLPEIKRIGKGHFKLQEKARGNEA